MSHAPDAPAAAYGATADAEPEPSGSGSENPARGLFSRLREVFAPTESPAIAPRAAEAAAQAAGRAADVLSLRRLRAEDVAIPKSDIVAVPDTISLDDLVEVFRANGVTRIPVYDGSLDHPLGLVNLKDLALRHGFAAPGSVPFDLRALLRPLLFVPPSMRAHTLLHKMQVDRVHMALVIDEYGGTDGLITIEDLIETIVGEIDDEHDAAEDAMFLRERDGVWLAQAQADLDDFESATGHALTAHPDVDAEDVDTLGGLVFLLAGHVPVRGEIVTHPDGTQFEVIDADPRRIRRLRVRLPGASDQNRPHA